MPLCELFKEELPDRVHPNEVDVIANGLSSAESGAWEKLSEQDGVLISLVAGEPRSGAVTLKAEARLPGVPVALAADQLNNFQQRIQWDQYVRDVTFHDVPAGENGYAVPGQLFYFVLHAPPFTDRDFVAQVVTCKSRRGDAYLTYTRSVPHEAYPAGMHGRVRGALQGCLVAVRRDLRDPENSSRMLLMTRQDIRLPYIPHWFINRFAPAKLVDFVQSLRRACETKRASRSAPPAEVLFWCERRAKLRLAEAPAGDEGESEDSEVSASTRSPSNGPSRASTASATSDWSEEAEPKECLRFRYAHELEPDLDHGPFLQGPRQAPWSSGMWLSPWQSCAGSSAGSSSSSRRRGLMAL